jgi:hypothetical protein
VTDLALQDDDDLFTPAEEAPRKETAYGLDEGGHRYKYPPPPGVEQPKPWIGWMRMTNLVSAFSDQERLQLWLEWKALMGLRANDGLLFEEWMSVAVEDWAPDRQKAAANQLAELARRAAGADAAARRGTARHTMMDTYLSEGVVTGTRSMRAQLASAMEALDRAGFDVLETEFRVWHPAAGGAMGTSDAKVMCRRTGQVGILDWKTQARFWTWQEIGGQLFGYDSAPWKWVGPADGTGHWERQEPNTLMGHPDGKLKGRRVALVAHMPQHPGPDQLPVEIHEVDMAYGKAVLECAARNIELRSVGRSQAESRRPAALRPPL